MFNVDCTVGVKLVCFCHLKVFEYLKKVCQEPWWAVDKLSSLQKWPISLFFGFRSHLTSSESNQTQSHFLPQA